MPNQLNYTFVLSLLLTAVISFLITIHKSHADGFVYNGGITSSDPEQQMKDHICLSFMVFLEARGDGETSQLLHAMTGINRALDDKRWSNTVCGVVSEHKQFSSISTLERRALLSVIMGDLNAVDEYIVKNYGAYTLDMKQWYAINEITYSLISAKDRGNDWVYADHFIVPSTIVSNGQGIPDWYYQKDILMIAGKTHFLKTKEVL